MSTNLVAEAERLASDWLERSKDSCDEEAVTYRLCCAELRSLVADFGLTDQPAQPSAELPMVGEAYFNDLAAKEQAAKRKAADGQSELDAWEAASDRLDSEREQQPEDTAISLDGLAAFIENSIEECQRLTTHLPKPIMSLTISNEGRSVDLCLDTSKSTYSEWIKGEGGDIGLTRDQESPHKVVGVHLPLYAKSLVIGGTLLPTIAFDLESGKDITQPSAVSSTGLEPDVPPAAQAELGQACSTHAPCTHPQGKATLGSDDPAGFYRCRWTGGSGTQISALYWDGSELRESTAESSETIDVDEFCDYERLALATRPTAEPMTTSEELERMQKIADSNIDMPCGTNAFKRLLHDCREYHKLVKESTNGEGIATSGPQEGPDHAQAAGRAD